jgi:hypothetical protein
MMNNLQSSRAALASAFGPLYEHVTDICHQMFSASSTQISIILTHKLDTQYHLVCELFYKFSHLKKNSKLLPRCDGEAARMWRVSHPDRPKHVPLVSVR